MAQFCTQCGNEIKPGSKFCMVCGKKIENDLGENKSDQNVSTLATQNKVTNNNNLVIVLLIALLVIGGVGWYFFLSRSSNYKESAVQSQSVQEQKLTKPDETVSNPTPAETPRTVAPPVQQFRVDQSNPRSAFISFHSAITNRQLAEAYNILSPEYQRFMRSYDNFVRGYNTTLRSDIVDLNELYRTPDFATYSYKLKAVDREGSGTKTQYFAGKATLILINGAWRLDKTEAKRI